MGDKCVDFSLVPHTAGIVALVTRKMLRKDVWQSGRILDTSKTKLGICKRNNYQLPRSGKFVPNDLQEVAENEVEDEIVFPMGHNTICKDVNFNSEGYLVRDPEDCTKFYSCQRGFNGAYKTAVNSEKWEWLAYHMECPVGTVFDGERCHIGFVCQNIKKTFERQIQEEVNEREEEKRTANLEKDFEVVDFTETPVIIVDTSDIENEFHVTQNDQKSDNDQRIISTKTTSTIIKDIPNNEFAETKNIIPVESHSIRTTETIVKKIPTKTTSAITNELPDDDLHRMTIEASESVHPMAKNVTNVIDTKASEIDSNEEEMQNTTNENVMEVSDIDSTSLPMEIIGLSKETSTKYDDTPVITLLPEEFTTKVFKMKDNDLKTTTDVPVESTSNTFKPFNIDIETETVIAVITEVPVKTTQLPLEITSNAVEIITMKDSEIEDLDEGSGIIMDTTFSSDETYDDETTVVPVDASLLPTETTTDNTGADSMNEERTEIVPNIGINTSDDETSTLNYVEMIINDVTTETEAHATHLVADETKENEARYEDNSSLLDAKIPSNNIKTATVEYETTVSPVFTTDSFVETTKNDDEDTNINTEALSRNDQTTLVFMDVEPMPTENENDDNGNATNEILDKTTLSPTETTTDNIKDMTDETTVAYIDTTVSFAETTYVSAETINNEAEATAVNDETTNVPVKTVETTIHNINDSSVFKPVDIPHSLDGIKNNGLEAEFDGSEITAMHDKITAVPDATTVFTATGDDETATNNIDTITRNDETTSISSETSTLFTEVQSTVKTTGGKDETTMTPNVETTVAAVSIEGTSLEPVEKTAIEPIAAIETEDIELRVPEEMEQTSFVPVEAMTVKVATANNDTETTEEIEGSTIMSVEATTVNKNIETATTQEIKQTTFLPVEDKTVKKVMETTTSEQFVPDEATTAKIETTTTEEIDETTFLSMKGTTANKDIESITTKEIEETTFLPIEALTEKKAIETTTQQLDETSLVSVETTKAKKAIETTTEQLDESTLVSVEAKTAEKAIETTASVEIEETSYAPDQSSTAWKDLASTAIGDNEETTVVPVKTTTAKK